MGPVDALDEDRFAVNAREANLLGRILEHSQRDFDLVLFDTPAGLGGMSRLALEEVDSVIAVAQCEPLALRALPRLLELLARLRDIGSACSLLGVVGTMSSFRDPVMLASLEELWSLYRDQVFDTAVPRDSTFLQASRAGVPLGLLSRRPPAVSAVFDKLVAEIEERLGTRQEARMTVRSVSWTDAQRVTSLLARVTAARSPEPAALVSAMGAARAGAPGKAGADAGEGRAEAA